MRALTNRERFAFIFSFYVFGFLLVVYSLFFLVFYQTIGYQLRRELTLETNQVVNSHLLIEKEGLVFRKNENGQTLKTILAQNNTAAIFYDKDRKVVRSYGLFSVEQGELATLAEEVMAKNQNLQSKIILAGQNLVIHASPLKNEEKILGVIILGKSPGEFGAISRMMLVSLGGLGFLSLIGSFGIGYFLAKRAFKPLRKMARILEGVNLERLDETIEIPGPDHDDLVILSRRFNEMTARLKDMAVRQKEFIGNASHELKTPLTRAISTLEMMPGEEAKLVKEDLFQMNELMERLLLLARMRKDHLWHLDPEPIKFDVLFSKIKGRYQEILRDKRISLEGNFPRRIKICLPEEYLLILLTNLVSNALKYSRPNSKVRLGVETDKRETTIKVADEGLGMSEEETIHIFDRFYQGSHYKEGFGVGLSIVKQICDLYEIKIEVKSEEDKGTLFTLVFPTPLDSRQS